MFFFFCVATRIKGLTDIRCSTYVRKYSFVFPGNFSCQIAFHTFPQKARQKTGKKNDELCRAVCLCCSKITIIPSLRSQIRWDSGSVRLFVDNLKELRKIVLNNTPRFFYVFSFFYFSSSSSSHHHHQRCKYQQTFVALIVCAFFLISSFFVVINS